ncbi:MAG: hypothetical protein HQL49_09265, partial [Gammaproteobacteria bacterium]|nr:hypothetical protein [Gammaproteobacteria bacterium]
MSYHRWQLSVHSTFWLLVTLWLTGCSDAADDKVAAPADTAYFAVTVVDGYGIGCAVSSGSGTAEITAVEEGRGVYRFAAGQPPGMISAVGCTDVSTNKQLRDLKVQPQSGITAAVASPLTTLLATLIEAGETPEAAAVALNALLGLPSGTDLTRFDHLKRLQEGNPTAIAVATLTARTVTTLEILANASGKSDAEIIAALLNMATATDATGGGSFVNFLENPSDMAALATALAISESVANPIAAAIVAVNNHISAITLAQPSLNLLTELAAVTIFATELTDDIATTLAGDSSALTTAVANIATLTQAATAKVNQGGFSLTGSSSSSSGTANNSAAGSGTQPSTANSGEVKLQITSAASITMKDGRTQTGYTITAVLAGLSTATSVSSSSATATNTVSDTRQLPTTTRYGCYSYAINGGVDKALFGFRDLATENGAAIDFIVAPDYEKPQDSDQNNSYLLEFTVTNECYSHQPAATQALTITVSDSAITSVVNGDLTAISGQLITLDSSDSRFSTAATSRWASIGDSVPLSTVSATAATFVAPEVNTPTVFTFRFSVSENGE